MQNQAALPPSDPSSCYRLSNHSDRHYDARSDGGIGEEQLQLSVSRAHRRDDDVPSDGWAPDALIHRAALQIAAHFQERLDELMAMLPFLEVATEPARTQPL